MSPKNVRPRCLTYMANVFRIYAYIRTFYDNNIYQMLNIIYKTAVILQTLSNAFLWMKSFVFWFQFYCNLFPRVQEPTRWMLTQFTDTNMRCERDEVNPQCSKRCPITSRCHTISSHADVNWMIIFLTKVRLNIWRLTHCPLEDVALILCV